MTVADKEFELFISAARINREVEKMAAHFNTMLAGREVVFLAILNGSFMYAADFLKHITLPCKVDFVKLASYRGTESTGEVTTLLGLGSNLENKHVVVIEDIVDTGFTLNNIHTTLLKEQPAGIYYSILLHKPEAAKTTLPPHMYSCFTIPTAFVVGYGLDYDGFGRNLPEIYTAKQ